MKAFYDIVFSNRDIGHNEKLFPPFQVRSNDMITERLLLPNFRAWLFVCMFCKYRPKEKMFDKLRN